MTKRILCSISIVSIGVFIASVVLFLGVLYNHFSFVQKNQLKVQTDLAAQGVANEGTAFFDGLQTDGCRMTLIARDGAVIYDSQTDTGKMENHLEREEVKQAFKNGYGESTRYSTTLMTRSLYSAKLLPDGTVLRLSVSQNTVLMLLIGMAQPICIIFIITAVLAVLLARGLAKKIVKPLNELGLDHPLENVEYDELSPLLRRIDSQQNQIKLQSRELEQKRIEFNAVTTNMKEGIVLLGRDGSVLSINPAAKKLLGTNSTCIGRDIISVNRSIELQELLQKSKSGEYAETRLTLSGVDYQFDASPVISDGKVSGTVLLILDVTAKEKAEKIRREFTANVSHELKTPLQTISGCAELMMNGIVKPEDVGKFSSQIYAETQRLVELIDDIIKLSHLDEGAADLSREDTDLYEIAKEATDGLAEKAKKADVTLSLSGESAVINGVPRLLHGIIYNLCDNAIKYNRRGGRVDVAVKQDENNIRLTVSDTGIGIPPEHRERIFERFYRVDKSRSKTVGGTGLGLSIIKHAAMLHGAEISLESTPNVGTTFTVAFPKNQARL